MDMHEKTVVIKQGGGFGVFLKGALFGAALALLFAPRSGHEIREMLGERGGEIVDKASYIAKDTRDRAQTLVSDARHKIEEGVKGAKDTADKTNKDLQRELEIMEDMNNPSFPL